MNVVLQPRLANKVYDEMEKVSRESYEKHLRGEWYYREHWELEWNELWKSVFRECRRLSEGGDNVFLVGTDTLAVKLVSVFEKYKSLTMFWHTVPAYTDAYPKGYMNSEPMYIPTDIPRSLWEKGERALNKASLDQYDWIQGVWNEMYWAQDPVPPKEPEMNYSPVVPNPIDPADAKIWHFHSSKNAVNALHQMLRMTGVKVESNSLPVLRQEQSPEKRFVIYDDGTGNPRRVEEKGDL